MAEASNPVPKRRMRVQKSCTECQRRKQKCIIRRPDAPCVNCARRFPPVECTITQVESCNPKPAYEDQVLTFELPSFSVASGKLPEAVVCFSDRVAASSSAASSSPDMSGALPLRAQKDRASKQKSQTKSHSLSERLDQDEERQMVRARLKTEARASLFLDGDGDPLAFFHNSPASIGGILTEVTTLYGMRLPESPRTAELLHFYVQVVAPNMVSIDGNSQPPVFLAEVLPWMLTSPLFPNIAILMWRPVPRALGTLLWPQTGQPTCPPTHTTNTTTLTTLVTHRL